MKHAKNFLFFIALQVSCGLSGANVAAQTMTSPTGSDSTSFDNSSSFVPAPWFEGRFDTEWTTIPFELKNENHWIRNDIEAERFVDPFGQILNFPKGEFLPEGSPKGDFSGNEEMSLPSDDGPIFVTPQSPNDDPSIPQFQGGEKCTIGGRVFPDICCQITERTREFFDECRI